MGNILVNVRFDENGLHDHASNKVWTQAGAVDFSNDGLFGGRCAYSNRAGYFTSPIDDRLNLGKSDFTVSFWVKPTASAGYGAMGVFGNTGAAYGDAFHTSINGSSDITFSNYRAAYGSYGWFTCPLLTLNEWHHIAFVRKDGIFYLFRNGVLGSTQNLPDVDWQFGAYSHALMSSAYSGGIASYKLAGYLDDFVILDEALWTDDFNPPGDYLVDVIGGGSNPPNELNIHVALDVNEKVDLTGYIYPVSPNVPQLLWSSDNAVIASVDAKGQVTGNMPGMTKIHARTPDNSWSAFVRIVVEEDATSELRLSILLEPDESCRLKALFAPTGTDKAIVWSSSNSAVAAVNSNGKVTAIAVGEAVIFVQTVDGSLKDFVYVTVVAA